MSTAPSAVDFATISVGDALPALRRQVTVEQIRAYAEASGDRNPIHLDEDFARSVGLPGVIAHGMLTMAFTCQILTNWMGNRNRLKALRCRFSAIVLPGDEVRCSGIISRKDPGRRRVTIDLTVENQRGERVLTKGLAEAEF